MKKTYHGVKGEKVTTHCDNYECNCRSDFKQTMWLYGLIILTIGIVLWVKV